MTREARAEAVRLGMLELRAMRGWIGEVTTADVAVLLDLVAGPVVPLMGLDAEALTRLRDAWPCLPAERHTFDAGALVCLCSALAVGIAQEHPHVVLYSPAVR